jgi:AcrR family transcriptional regulator
MSSDSAKERVQRAALEGFAADGLWGLNLADVRRRSGISTGSLYHHFPNGLEQVLLAIYEKAVAEVHRTVIEAIDEQTSFEGCFRTAVSGYLAWHAEHPTESDLVITVSNRGFPSFVSLLRERDRVFAAAVLDRLEGHASRQQLTLASRALLLPILLGTSRAVVHDWASEGRDPADRRRIARELPLALLRACVVESVAPRAEVARPRRVRKAGPAR